ncbi:copper chaperone PCu(A)C [Novosphingobium sp.]|uniref:copper chaperone PCu(A)C n=1 Tax=Novosphingobium sp. TaxID=1874826 RepID=UPI00286D8669|nr:copper chaperone PCu(A)C [Novosphingobium sp.]
MRARLLAPALAVSLLLLAGCSEGKNEVVVTKSTVEGLQVTDPRLVLPIVKDSPGAVYFTLVNSSAKPRKILSIEVAGGDMAMIHDTVDKGGHSSMTMAHDVVVAAGSSMAFAPGGRHVMVTGLKPGLKPGVDSELKINFDTGDALVTNLPVVAPAAAAGN